MPSVIELLESRDTNYSLSDPQHERIYSVDGYADEDSALSAVLGAAPPTVTLQGRELILVNVNLKVLARSQTFKAKLDWKIPDRKDAAEPPETNDSEFGFSVQTQTVNVTHALSQNRYPSTAPSHGTAINVDENGQPQGIDQQFAVAEYTETHWLPESQITVPWFRTISGIVGKTNNATFRNFTARELLLTGVDGSRRGRGDWRVNFRWAHGTHQTGITVAGISSVNKEAHDYVWVTWEKEVDGTANRFKVSAVGVYVARIYDQADYSGLGIGTT